MTPRSIPPPGAPGSAPSLPLPTFRSGSDRERAVLEASRAVVALFLRERSSDFSVKELADHAGLSERTFYRYFPRKEDAIRPYIEAGLASIVGAVRDAPRTRPLRDVLVAAHADLLDLALAHDGRAFLALLEEQESLRAAWLQVLTDAETAFAQAVAEWTGGAPDAVNARFAGACVVTAGRVALASAGSPEECRAPSRVFADCLDLLGPALFAAPAGPSSTPPVPERN